MVVVDSFANHITTTLLLERRSLSNLNDIIAKRASEQIANKREAAPPIE